MFRVQKELTWDMAHALANYEGKCKKIHGHTWKAIISYRGQVLDKAEMLMDFGNFKSVKEWIDQNWDHNCLLSSAYPHAEVLQEALGVEWGIVITPFNPTSERVAEFLHAKTVELLKVPRWNVEVTVFETCTSGATYKEG